MLVNAKFLGYLMATQISVFLYVFFFIFLHLSITTKSIFLIEIFRAKETEPSLGRIFSKKAQFFIGLDDF